MIKRVLAIISKDEILENFKKELLVSETEARAGLEKLKAKADEIVKENDGRKDAIWLRIERYVDDSGFLPQGIFATSVNMELIDELNCLAVVEKDEKNPMQVLMEMAMGRSNEY